MKHVRTSPWGLFALLLIACPTALGQDQQLPNDFSDGDVRDIPFGVERLLAPRWRLADGPHVRAAFREVVRDAVDATVRVWSGGKQAALGGIVDSDGLIVTKASVLEEPIVCELADGRELKARLAGFNGQYDVALLEVEAGNLPTLEISQQSPPEVGSWLASVGPDGDPVAVGVVSVGPREIPPQAGVLGIQLAEIKEARIVKVFPDSGAERAGMKEGDVVVEVDGKAINSRLQLIRTIRGYHPGDRLPITVRREEETIEVRAMLGGRFSGLEPTRSQFQNDLGGRLSVRRFGFPRALQHDTVLAPDDCGGPLVDLQGKVVGINIARSGRTESYAIAGASLTTLIDELKSQSSVPDKQARQRAAVTTP